MKPVKENRYVFIFLLAACLFFAGCEKEEKPPENLNELSKIYAELMIVKISYPDDKLEAGQDSVYTMFGYTKEEYENDIKNIQPVPDIWDKFFEQAKAHIDSLQKQERENQN